MILKLYSFTILIIDLISLFVKCIIATLEAIYRLFVPRREKSVAGEIVLITGAGHGMGREMALQFSALGATVVCWDINPETNEDTVVEVKKMGGRAFGYRCDVSDRVDVLRVAEEVKRDVGDITILINNAGIMPCNTYNAYNPQEIKRCMDINVFAHFWTVEAFLPRMVEKNHGHIVAMSSVAGLGGFPNLVPYCASKFAVRGLMEAVEEEIRTSQRNLKVRFTTVYPFIVSTGLVKNAKLRFPNVFGMLDPKYTVSQIITGVRRDHLEITIPSFLWYMQAVLRVCPRSVVELIVDFIDTSVEPETPK